MVVVCVNWKTYSRVIGNGVVKPLDLKSVMMITVVRLGSEKHRIIYWLLKM